jgi:Zn-dependent peptidase ImmA (M78 family)
MSVDTLAEKTGNSVLHLERLIQGKEEITQELSVKLARHLGASMDFWLRREQQYRDDLIRLNRVDESSWLKMLPITDMVRYGWIKKETSKSVSSLLAYFGVISITEWHEKYEAEMAQVSFRTSGSFKQQPASVAAWIRQGELQSQPIECGRWDKELFRASLIDIKKLTKIKDPIQFLPKLSQICAKCGVAVVIAKTPRGCQASGVTKFLSEERALIMLSFRYLSDDQFWFTFFHEAGHLLIHNKRSVFVEESAKNRTISIEEQEANEFAAELLIPVTHRPQLMKIAVTNKKSVIGFASMLGISPGIVIGQLQHMGRIEYGRYNYYKRKYVWENIAANLNP